MKNKCIGCNLIITVSILMSAIGLTYNASEYGSGADEFISVEGENYALTFCDDFDGEKLDKSKWSLCEEQERKDVGGYWDNSMTSLDGNGNLVLTAAVSQGRPISGAIRTKNKFEQARGYFEVRCRLQQAEGFWGAFWLMCPEQENVGNGACDGAEIDIFESCNVKVGGISHAIHWDGYGDYKQKVGKVIEAPGCYDGQFHTFSLLWTDKEYVFYIDNKESYRISEGDEGFPGSNIIPSYLKLTTEFGSWAGRYDEDELPDNILVDYVKVYERIE